MSTTLTRPWLRSGVIVGAVCLASLGSPASAGDGGAVAAGMLGGVAVGAIAGSAITSSARRPVYYSYYAPAPVYVAPSPRCWFAPQQVWTGYAWMVQSVRVCQ